MKVGDYVKCLCNDKIGIITKIYMTGHGRAEFAYPADYVIFYLTGKIGETAEWEGDEIEIIS